MYNRRANDASDIFWPGYVDAISNLVLNLLFLLMIMTIGIFIYGLEMGIGASEKMSAPQDVDKPQVQIQTKNDISAKPQVKTQANDNMPAQTETAPEGRKVIVSATLSMPAQVKGLNYAANGPNEVIVKFNEDAVGFIEQEYEELRQALKSIVSKGKAHVFCDYPAGFSEAKRLCYYRVMAVRNILIEMDMPSDLITVELRRGGEEAKSSIVRVTPQP